MRQALALALLATLPGCGPAGPAARGPAAPLPPAAGPLLIDVLADGKFVVNGRTAENAEALVRLLGALKVDRNVPVMLHVEESALWEQAVAAFEAAIRAGFTKIGFSG